MPVCQWAFVGLTTFSSLHKVNLTVHHIAWCNNCIDADYCRIFQNMKLNEF